MTAGATPSSPTPSSGHSRCWGAGRETERGRSCHCHPDCGLPLEGPTPPSARQTLSQFCSRAPAAHLFTLYFPLQIPERGIRQPWPGTGRPRRSSCNHLHPAAQGRSIPQGDSLRNPLILSSLCQAQSSGQGIQQGRNRWSPALPGQTVQETLLSSPRF